MLKNEEFIAQLKTKLAEFISINRDSVEDLTVVWATIKGFIRNNAIGFSSQLNKTRVQRITLLGNYVRNWKTHWRRTTQEKRKMNLRIKEQS